MNDIPAGAVTSSNAGSNTGTASATLNVGSAPAAEGIPTLGEWGMMLMAAMLAMIALKTMR